MGMRIDEAGRDDKFGGVDNLGRGTVLDAPDFGDATRLYRDVGAIRWLTRSVYYRSVFDQNVVGHQRPLIYSFAFLILDTANSLYLDTFTGRINPRAPASDLYLLLQFGGRFSAKASAPSRASSVPCSQVYSSRSSLSPSARGRSRPRRAACLMRETASGALLQISVAISSHLLMSLFIGTT